MLVASCSKDDPGSFVWEKTGGDGLAIFSSITADSMFLFAGSSSNKPYIIKTGKSGSKIFSYQPDIGGRFTSAVEDTSGFFLAGASGGTLLLSRLSKDGTEIWTKSVDAAAEVLTASILKISDNTFLAVAGDHPDSVRFDSFLMVYFDRDGEVVESHEPAPGYKVAINDATTGPAGELYLAITKVVTGTKTRASIGRFTSEGLKVWERELYNNPLFGAATLEIDCDESGNIYATGYTELAFEDELLTNSWVSSLAPGGSVLWKSYLESSNFGEEILFDQNFSLLVMNRNCGTINFLSESTGTIDGRLRVYEVCDPYDTGIKLFSMAVAHDGRYIMAGSKSEKFYYALRKGYSYDN